MGPKSNMTSVPIIREETQTQTQKKGFVKTEGRKHAKTEADTGVIRLLGSERQGWPATTRR